MPEKCLTNTRRTPEERRNNGGNLSDLQTPANPTIPSDLLPTSTSPTPTAVQPLPKLLRQSQKCGMRRLREYVRTTETGQRVRVDIYCIPCAFLWPQNPPGPGCRKPIPFACFLLLSTQGASLADCPQTIFRFLFSLSSPLESPYSFLMLPKFFFLGLCSSFYHISTPHFNAVFHRRILTGRFANGIFSVFCSPFFTLRFFALGTTLSPSIL